MNEASAIVAGEPPDWAAVSEEIECPLCGYNLRGLTEPRCPECGYGFEWPKLLDPALRRHPYLFEHHPRHNAWSFFKTLWGSARPRKFWRALHPQQRGSVGRLLTYWVLTQLAVLFIVGGVFTTAAVQLHRNSTSLRKMYGNWRTVPQFRIEGLAPLAPSPEFFEKAFEHTRERLQLDEYGIWLLVCFAWPWMTLAALSLFQTSMRKARIRQVHVLRCVLYSADAVVWYYPGVVVIYGVYTVLEAYQGVPVIARILFLIEWHDGFEAALMIATGLLAVTIGYRLWQAYRLYLNFDHSFLTVVSSQVIVVLLMLLVGVFGGAIY